MKLKYILVGICLLPQLFDCKNEGNDDLPLALVAGLIAAKEPTAFMDNSFGTDGMASIRVRHSGQANGMVIQTDGKIVVTGYSYDELLPTKRFFSTLRLNSNGTLDTSFGTTTKLGDRTGMVHTDFTIQPDADNVAMDVALQADNKIVVVGYSNANSGTPTDYDIALVRYNTDGSYDTSFGAGNGKVLTNISPTGMNMGRSVSIQDDGRIVVAGVSGYRKLNYGDFLGELCIVRYNSDGTLDLTLNGTGISCVTLPSTTYTWTYPQTTTQYTEVIDFNSQGYSAEIQADGSIHVVGSRTTYDVERPCDSSTILPSWDPYPDCSHIMHKGPSVFYVIFNSDGSYQIPGDYQREVVTVNDNGAHAHFRSISSGIVGGYTESYSDIKSILVPTDNEFAVGTLDSGNSAYEFNFWPAYISMNEKLYDDILGAAWLGSVAKQMNGKHVVVGSTKSNDDNNVDFSIARYIGSSDPTINPTDIDRTFGGNGYINIDMMQTGSNDVWNDLDIQSDGKIVVAGFSDSSNIDANGYSSFVVGRCKLYD